METIVIIGAGASGLACMNTLRQSQQYNIIVLEQSSKSARKILASGNGRCNVSHLDIDMSSYNTQSPIIEKIIKQFDIKDFFDQLSLKLRYEKSLIYPYSLSSQSVKDALLQHQDDISLIENCEVTRIEYDQRYRVICQNGSYQADKIVIATGSPASHLSGEHNLNMLQKLKVKINPFTPSLVQLKTKPTYPMLKGLRVKCLASLYDGQSLIDQQTGEVLFTDYGLSGICIMQLSRYYPQLKQPRVVLNLLPDLTQDDIKQYPLHGLFHYKLTNLLEKKQLNPQHLSFEVIETMGIEKAQVCHGGVDLSEVDDSLQLKKYPGIYVCGEALDVDGDCGGYNLHFAFGSGEHVGKSIIGENYVKNK